MSKTGILILISATCLLTTLAEYIYYKELKRHCIPYFNCEPGNEIVPCATSFTNDRCVKCQDGYVQPDLILMSSNDSSSTSCFKPLSQCLPGDMFTWILSNLNVQTVLVGIAVILLIFELSQRLKYKLPPGPLAIPFIGNIQLLRKQDFQQKWHEYRKKYGPVFQIQLGLQKMVLLNDINVVTEALVKKKADFANRPQQPSSALITDRGKNIGNSNYSPLWKLQRKIAVQAIRLYMTGPTFENLIHKISKDVLDKMAEEDGAFNPEPHIDSLMFHIIYTICFGDSQSVEEAKFKRFMYLDKSVNAKFAEGFLEDNFPFLINIWTTSHFKEFLQEITELRDVVGENYYEHKKTLDPDHIRDLTDTLIMARKEAELEEDSELLSKLTDAHLLNSLIDVVFGGIDTSKFTLLYALRYMASYPEIQKKCQEEIDRTVGRNRPAEIKDREELSYCEATLYEIMRLGTVAPIGIPHATLCDTSVGGYDIPKDTFIIINHWELHHDPEFWPDVEKFDPTRYLDENGKIGRKPESWLPFSAGRRNCAGETVAKPELHLLFVAFLQRFEISLGPGVSSEVQMNKQFGLTVPMDYTIVVKERE